MHDNTASYIPKQEQEHKNTTPKHAYIPNRKMGTDKPYMWSSVCARKRIRELIPGPKGPLETYSALCEIAQERRAEVFTVTESAIGEKCCLTARSVRENLKALRLHGLIDYKDSEGMYVAKSYRLLSVKPLTGDVDENKEESLDHVRK